MGTFIRGSLGDLVRYTMEKRGYSTRDLARELEMANSTAWRISNGQPCELRFIIPIARWLKLRPSQLWRLLEMEQRVSKVNGKR